jgi:hypothetical protein
MLQLPKEMQRRGKLWNVTTSKNNVEKARVLECCNYPKNEEKGRRNY